MQSNRSLVSPTSHPTLQKALEEKLATRQIAGHSLGQLDALAIRLGLLQGTLSPRFRDPQLLIFAADHGLAVDGIAVPAGQQTQHLVQHMLTGKLPLSVFARTQQVELAVIDCGVSENLQVHEQLLVRKIAHGTRNSRVTSAMSVEQAHAAMRAGMELGNKLRGNATLLAGVGVGAHESAAMVLARLTECPIRDLLLSGPDMPKESLSHTMKIVRGVQNRHRAVADPVEVLAAYGGFEVAVMVGVMLMAAGRRQLLVIDGMAACAALMIASRIAPPVTDYCVFARSHPHKGLDAAMGLFRASALLEMGLEHIDGTGAALTWPIVRCAAALLSDPSEELDADLSEPVPFADHENAFDDTFNDAHLGFRDKPLY
jgi:nicotinate-nucleotide--dimethylbenzimidazole phosphoribosyltransferase